MQVKADLLFDQVTNINMKRSQQISQQIKKINQTINAEIFDQEPDNNDNSKPSEKSHWTTFIRRIAYLKNGHMEVYTTNEFQKLSSQKRITIINRLQDLAIKCVNKFKDPKTVENDAIVFAVIFSDGSYIGRSQIFSPHEFKWNK